jgi:hypothetical protein
MEQAYVEPASINQHAVTASSLTREGVMPRFAFLCCAAVIVGCTKSEDRAADDQTAMDTAMAAPEAPAASATMSLADVAGKWKVRSTDEAGGNVVETGLVATADTSGWTMTAPNRKPIPVRVVGVAGDSIVTETGPFESFIRKGVQVTTRTVYRLQDGKLVGTVEARYATKAGDSVAHRPTEGTRVP